MAYRLVPYTAEWQAAATRFNDRLRGHPDTPFLLPDAAAAPFSGGPLQRQHWLMADEEGEVRGGCLLQTQPGWAGGGEAVLCNLQSPLTEGLADRRYVGVALTMLREATRLHPFTYSVGMGSEDKPYPRLLRALAWQLEPVPFFFRVLAGRRFLAHMRPLRTHPRFGPAARMGGWVPLLPDLAFTALHAWRAQSPAPPAAGTLPPGDPWCSIRTRFGFAMDRTAPMLDALYPPGDSRFVRLSHNGALAILFERRFQNHSYFGDMHVATLVDLLAPPGAAGPLLAQAARWASQRGVALLLTNQSDPVTITALQAVGWLSYKSNYLASLSPALRKARAEAPIYLTRGDGDGLVNL